MQSMPWWKDYDFWTAVGTVGAVVLAVLGTLIHRFWEWYRRPVLTLNFGNRDPWRRLGRAQDNAVYSFFRISVENTGHRIAYGVKGFAFEFLNADGSAREDFDPIALHWAGTGFDATPLVNLLPGQREFLDVVQVMHSDQKERVLDASETQFLLIPQVPIPRGLQLFDQLRGQSVRVRVSGENAELIGMKLTLPLSPRGAVPEIEMQSEILDQTDSWFRLLHSWREHKKAMGAE